MSSSFLLKKRNEQVMPDGSPVWELGPYNEHYVAPFRQVCHPDYFRVAIGKADGPAMCVLRPEVKQQRAEFHHKEANPTINNGYKLYSQNLYQPGEQQIQLYNPYKYNYRQIPNHEELVMNDYLKRPIKYDAIGDKPINRGPECIEYYYQAYERPPPKYNVTHLTQLYPVWRKVRQSRGDTEEMLRDIDKGENRYITPI
jgi:hypothetical protein